MSDFLIMRKCDPIFRAVKMQCRIWLIAVIVLGLMVFGLGVAVIFVARLKSCGSCPPTDCSSCSPQCSKCPADCSKCATTGTPVYIYGFDYTVQNVSVDTATGVISQVDGSGNLSPTGTNVILKPNLFKTTQQWNIITSQGGVSILQNAESGQYMAQGAQHMAGMNNNIPYYDVTVTSDRSKAYTFQVSGPWDPNPNNVGISNIFTFMNGSLLLNVNGLDTSGQLLLYPRVGTEPWTTNVTFLIKPIYTK